MSENENRGTPASPNLISIRSFEIRQCISNNGKKIVLSIYENIGDENSIGEFDLEPANAASIINILKSGTSVYDSGTEYIIQRFDI